MDKSENKKKLLDLPTDVISVLESQAKKERRSVKSLMETILINAAKQIDLKDGK